MSAAPAGKTLLDTAPREFATYTDVRAYRYKDKAVVSTHDGTVERWPGPHKHVYVWWTLDNGMRVGWNENPAKGWSFPVLPRVKG